MTCSANAALFLLLLSICYAQGSLNFPSLLTNLTVDVLKMKHTVIFGCHQQDLRSTSRELLATGQFVYAINMKRTYVLNNILTRKSHARTGAIVDCACKESRPLLKETSIGGFFNKTYQWLLWDYENVGVETLLPPDLTYFGPNAQVTYLNKSAGFIKIWDVHSKGRHLGSPLELQLIAESEIALPHELHIKQDIFELQSIQRRDRFHGLNLRGATVIDLDNITTNQQIEKLFVAPGKQPGITAFTKYHYELVSILRERFNFSVNFRVARGWAGRLGNTSFRLGYLGMLQRNEADIGASALSVRLNRFAEYDIIHEGWLFEVGFVYRFTPDLDAAGKTGDFLAPFDMIVWYVVVVAVILMNITWRLIEWTNAILARKLQKLLKLRRAATSQEQDVETVTDTMLDSSETSLAAVTLKTIAAMSQQGLDPVPKGLASRTIVFTIFLFSLIIYNYYTSSVVGGLLSSTTAGPSTVDEIVSSPLKLSFEDIGYYKVLFKERKSPRTVRLINTKILPPRSAADLPIFTHIEQAMNYLKNGTFAFHCELVDAYPEIAKNFDANEICELRTVTGLMETTVLGMCLPKNSQYSELFRNVMCRAREVGFTDRLLKKLRPPKPSCQALYTVYPVALSGVSNAFLILLAGFFFAVVVLLMERLAKRWMK